MIQTEKILVKTENEDHIVNITDVVQNTLTKSGVKEGFILVFLQSTTSSLTVMEFEDGVLIDLPRALGRLAPKSIDYEHEKAYRDGNEHSHVKSSAVGIDLAVPFKDGLLLPGTWQQIVAVEFDIRWRNRSIIAQIVSE